MTYSDHKVHEGLIVEKFDPDQMVKVPYLNYNVTLTSDAHTFPSHLANLRLSLGNHGLNSVLRPTSIANQYVRAPYYCVGICCSYALAARAGKYQSCWGKFIFYKS
jgi:hypothetical protein